MLRIITALLLAGALAGCGPHHQRWHAKDISGLMPDLQFHLTDDNGKAVTGENYRGRIALLFFGYTYCPDYCPTTLSRLHQAIAALPEDARKSITVLFVSVDPKRDTPAKLKQYAGYFGPQVVGLTGDMDTLRNLTKRYRTTFSYGKPDASGNYVVNHGLAVYAFDRDGAVHLLITDDESIPDLTADLRQLAAT